jgi:drug/metabolite transporter (DMT)-like permease
VIIDPERRRRLAIAFLLGAAWGGLVGGILHALGDDGGWARFAFRVVYIGVLAMIVASMQPPRHLRQIQPALRRAVRTQRLPADLDVGPWRAALRHQRGLLWVLRGLVPVCLGAGAAAGVAAALVSRTVSPLALELVSAGLAAGAIASFVWGGRRRAAIDGLLAELDERGVRAD